MSTSKKLAPGSLPTPQSLPTRLFTCGSEPEFMRSFSYRSGLENLPILSDLIPIDELDQIRNGPLGVILRFYENGFLWSARLVHELLVNQLVTDKKYEFWTLCGGQAMRFSLKEFEIITGLNCEAYPSANMDIEDDPQFLRRLGMVENREPTYNMVKRGLMNCKDWSSRDRIRLIYLFLVFRFLLARHPGTGIDSKAAFLVLNREKFEAYPWGRVAFQYLIESIFKAKPDLSHDSYGVNGFVQVLQVWAYEAIPAIGKKYGKPRKDMTVFPPLLRWKGSRKRFTYDLPLKRELVFVNGVMDNSTSDQWEDEAEDVRVDNMLMLIATRSGKVFEKHFWAEKGLEDGPGKTAEEEDDQTKSGENLPLKKKRKSKVIVEDKNIAWKINFASYMERMVEKLQKEISTYVNDAVKKVDSRMDVFEESIKEVQGSSKNIDVVIKRLEAYIKRVQEPVPVKEDDGKKERSSINESSVKKSKKVGKFELHDISIEELPSQEDHVDYKTDDASSDAQGESSFKDLSETSSIRDRNMKKQMDSFAMKMKALIKKKPIQKEKRVRKLPAQLKSPFTSTNVFKKIIAKDCPWTVYDPFEQVEEALVASLDEWLIQDMTVQCGFAGEKQGKKFFQELRTPQCYISNNHIDAGMTLFRRRSLMTPCPYRDGRIAFMDSGFTLVIGNNYKSFEKDRKNYAWSFGATDYYNGVMPIARCTKKQLGKDIDDIYVVIHMKGNHWAALAISIPNITIHVYDSIIVHTTDEEIQEYVKPYARMIPHMLKAFASEKKGISVAKFKVQRRINVPQNIQTGDCGVYAIKYIECLAIGCEFKGLCDRNIGHIRAKLAAEIFDESKNVGFY